MKVIGVGSSFKGKSVHLVLGQREGVKKNQCFCDKRTKNLIVLPKLTVADVTCAKCKRSKTYKEMLDAMNASKPVRPEPIKELPKKVEEKQQDLPLEIKKEKELKELNEFKLYQQTDEKFSIRHVPSDKIFFKSLDEALAIAIVEKLNRLTVGWDGKGSIPKAFLSLCLDIFKKAHQELSLALPVKYQEREKEYEKKDEEQKEKEEKAGRKLTRRGVKKGKEKSEIKISRREKYLARSTSQITIARPIKRRTKNPTQLIRSQLVKGNTFSELVYSLINEFGLSEIRARARFKAIIRKLSRVQGRRIEHTFGKNHLDDFYKFKIEKE